MKKTLKSIKSKYGMLNEGYAWERQEGKPLPTLADVQEKYNAKSVNEQEQLSKEIQDLYLGDNSQVGQLEDNGMRIFHKAKVLKGNISYALGRGKQISGEQELELTKLNQKLTEIADEILAFDKRLRRY